MNGRHETPPEPDLERYGIDEAAVNARVREIVIESRAYETIENDPVLREVVTARDAAEQALNIRARDRAVQDFNRIEEEERARREGRYPWGVDYLRDRQEGGRRHDVETIYAGLGEAAMRAERNDQTARERAEVLGEKAHEERDFTLGIAKRVEDRLHEENVSPDIEIFVQKMETVKDRAGFRRHGRDKLIKAKRQKPTYGTPDYPNKGWKLPMQGTADDTSRVILLEDGSLLVAYGRLTPTKNRAPRKDPDTKRNRGKFDMDRLDVRPNRTRAQVEEDRKLFQRVTRKAPKQTLLPERTYSRIIDEDLHSDIGLPNSATLGAAYRQTHLLEHEGGGRTEQVLLTPDEARIFFSREKDLQDAMVRLMVQNRVPLERGEDSRE
jgi:hypothetical protein